MTNPYRAAEMITFQSAIFHRGSPRVLMMTSSGSHGRWQSCCDVALIIGMGLLFLGTTYGPSRVVQSQAPMTQPAPQTNERA